MGIMIILSLIMLTFCMTMVIITGKAKNQGKEKRVLIENKIKSATPIFSLLSYFEQEGLPIVTQSVLGIILCKDKIMIVDELHDFVINKEQIKEIKYFAEKEVEKELKTSTAKGLAGAAVLGTAGAVIGSQPKQKTVSNVTISDLYIKYVNSKGQDDVIKISCRNNGLSNIAYKMKDFETKANEVLLYVENRIGTIQL